MSSSSSFPHKHDQKLKSIVVAGEEKETIKNPEQRSPQAIVSERTITERPSFGLGVVRKEKDKMKICSSSKDNKFYICLYCRRGFQSRYALGGHQQAHKVERELEKQLKKKNESRIFDQVFYEENTKSLVNLLTDENDLETSPGPLASMGGSGKGNSSNAPSLDVGVTRGAPDVNMTMVTHDRSFNENTSYISPSSYQGLSSGVFNYGEGSSSRSTAYPLFNGAVIGGVTEMKSTMFPSLFSDQFLAANASYRTLSRDPLPSNNYSSHDLSNDDINLELTLGPPKSTGSSNNNNNIYPSFNGEVTRGTKDLNLPVLPRVSLYQFSIGNPLGSITRDIPPLPSPAPFLRSPVRTTNLPNGMFSFEENGASCSNSRSIFDSKGKNKVMVPEDDGKGLGMIRWSTKKKRSRRG